jgi:hypothetical protein
VVSPPSWTFFWCKYHKHKSLRRTYWSVPAGSMISIVVCMPLARQQSRKNRDSSLHAAMEVLVEAEFSVWFAPRLYHATNRVQFS